MHLKRCYIFRVYSRGREVHGWIVPYHIQVRVYLSSPRLPYIFLVCVSSVSGKKTGYEKKREGPRSKVYTSMCVCVCVFSYFVCLYCFHESVSKIINFDAGSLLSRSKEAMFLLMLCVL